MTTEETPLKSYRGRIYTRLSLSQVFWSHVIEGPPDDCWLWGAARFSNGYGHIGRNGKSLLAHRVAWELHRGPIPGGLLVLHHCDTRACCNYRSHLFLGTPSDNSHDMVTKGRHPAAREGFIPKNLGVLRSLCAKGHAMTPDNVIFTDHGLARRCVICYQNSLNAAKARYLERHREDVHHVSKLTHEALEDIALNGGIFGMQVALARKYGISRSYVSHIFNGDGIPANVSQSESTGEIAPSSSRGDH